MFSDADDKHECWIIWLSNNVNIIDDEVHNHENVELLHLVIIPCKYIMYLFSLTFGCRGRHSQGRGVCNRHIDKYHYFIYTDLLWCLTFASLCIIVLML